MNEPDNETEQVPNLIKKDEVLAHKITRCLKEKPITQEEFLNRSQWQKELAESITQETTLVVILDLVGGSKLEEAFSERMQKVINGIDNWKNQNTPDHELAGTYGRRIEVQERLPGEDEVVFFICPKPEEDSKQLLKQLNQSIKSATGVDAVYIGASENPAGGKLSTALRAADIALKRKKGKIKQKPEGQREYSPGIVSVTANHITFEGQEINPKEMEIKTPKYPDNVILENVVEHLRAVGGKMTLLSPQSMKEINAKFGMEGGDQVLIKLTEQINKILQSKGKPRIKIYKIGTIFAVPNVEFTQDKLNTISSLLPKGLSYNNLSQ